MAETIQTAREVQLTLEVLLGGGYKAADRLHGVYATGRTDADALRRLHGWLAQRGLADDSTVYQITRTGRPASIRDERYYSLTARQILAGAGGRPGSGRPASASSS